MTPPTETRAPRSAAATMLNKVPEVTVLFWVVKICSTTVGETGADFLNDTLGFGLTLTTVVTAVLLALGLTWQLRLRRYVPAVYWTNVVLISVAGTLFSDNLVDGWGVPLAVSTSLFAVALAATFIAWYRSERTLSIHSITTRRREGFYWTAILFAFALGTSAGDWLAEGLGLGYLPSALLFAAVIGVIAVARFGFRADAVATFWAAYVMTRPLGASIGDLLSQSTRDGGLGLGTVWTSDVFLAVIVAGVLAFTFRQRHDRQQQRLVDSIA